MAVSDIIFLPSAKRRLRMAHAYIETEQSTEKAEAFWDGLMEKALTLMDDADPNIGQQEPNLEHLGLGHRYLLFQKFKIVYRVVGDAVYITDIFHTRQDPEGMSA